MVESLETAAGVPIGGWTFGGFEGSGSVAEDRLSLLSYVSLSVSLLRDLGALHKVHTNTAYKLLNDTL